VPHHWDSVSSLGSPCGICGEQSVTETSFASILSVHQNSTLNWHQCWYERLIRDFMFIMSQSTLKPIERRTSNTLPFMKPEYPYSVRNSQSLIPPCLVLGKFSPSNHNLFPLRSTLILSPSAKLRDGFRYNLIFESLHHKKTRTIRL